jgi:lipoprotein-anchoring transpeptidase ErfK/SrfK
MSLFKKVACLIVLVASFCTACTGASPQAALENTAALQPLSPTSEAKNTPTIESTPAYMQSASPSTEPTEAPDAPTTASAPSPTADPFPYYIYVEKGSYTITVYAKDEQGNYTKEIKTFLTAVGKTSVRTPTGKFKIGKKDRWHRFSSENGGYLYAQYATNFNGSLYVHSSLYSSKEIDRLMPAYYVQLGQKVTAGCLRTTTYAAWWIYTYCPEGTTLEVVNGSPKGTMATKPPDPVQAEGSTWKFYDPYDPLRPGFTEPPQ